MALDPRASTEPALPEQSPSDTSKEPGEVTKQPLGELSDEELGSVSGGFVSIGGFAPATTIKTTL